ncbi:MAG: ribonuclease P protein component [Candidatus Parcubacteria bacterium]|nr:ribonuclease P protein component [Candidatus Parcubacteria bacterium]
MGARFYKEEDKKVEKELLYKMLPKIHRLRKKKDFERVYKKGKGFRQGFLFLKSLNNDSKISRIGIVVSKKVALRAVVRNLIKRRIRAATKDLISDIEPGQDIVISALTGINKTTDFKKIKETVNDLLLKSGIINKKTNERIC